MSFTISYINTDDNNSSNFYEAQGTSFIISPSMTNIPDIKNFTISPSLPLLINMNPETGDIIGNPKFSSISDFTEYTVDVSYNDESNVHHNTITTFFLSISIPPIFSYDDSPYFRKINTLEKTIVPTFLIFNADGTTYSISGNNSLPDGFTLNSTNGEISGIPTILSSTTTYTVTSTINKISYDASFVLTVDTDPILSYQKTEYILTQNIPININHSIIVSLTDITFSIDGCPLPRGLTFNTTTGEITGTPFLLTTTREYQIRVINAVGTTSIKMILSVVREFLSPRAESDNFPSNLRLSDPENAMRLKAEILKHEQNKLSLTKQQSWSQTVNGNGRFSKRVWGNQNISNTNPNISGLPEDGNTIICSDGLPSIICNPSSSSDVPGPVTTLCYNPSIPLISYSQPNRFRTNIGRKWPQRAWSLGNLGFPRGKSGTDTTLN